MTALLTLVGTLLATQVSAALLVFTGNSSDGHAVSGQAEFTFNAAADTVTVKLTNTTTTTLDAGELFTGLDFSLGGLVPSLTSDTAIQRSVANNGSFVDTGSPQNISWSLVASQDRNHKLLLQKGL